MTSQCSAPGVMAWTAAWPRSIGAFAHSCCHGTPQWSAVTHIYFSRSLVVPIGTRQGEWDRRSDLLAPRLLARRPDYYMEHHMSVFILQGREEPEVISLARAACCRMLPSMRMQHILVVEHISSHEYPHLARQAEQLNFTCTLRSSKPSH